MASKEIVIHQSSLKTYRRCHRAYYYKYILKLEKRKKSSSLVRGSCVHEMIEAKANGKNPWEAFEEYIQRNQPIFTEQDPEYEGLSDMIETIMSGYFNYYKDDPFKPVKIGDKSAEHKFSVDLGDNIILEGVIDMIVENDSLGIGLMDHKTHKTIPTGDIAYSNIQSALYALAMEKSKDLPNPKYMVWNYIRWKAPTKPRLLKSGAMSKSVSDTTWEVYKEELINNNLNPEDYLDVKNSLKGKEQDFYIRQVLPINDNIKSGILEDTVSTAKQIRDNPEVKDRNITKDCSWCEFYSLCQAELKGLDKKMILKYDYKEKENE